MKQIKKLNSDNINNKKGFSLGELLVVVAVILILCTIAVPSIISIRRNLRQRELDAKAETIYMAVQSRLSELYTAGLQYKYDPNNYSDGSIKVCNFDYPADYDPDTGTKINKNGVYYILSGDNSAATEIVTSDILDESLYSGHWVIEFMPYAYSEDGNEPVLSAASVYAVYYSEDLADFSTEYVNDNDLYNLKLRVKENRIKDNARVGYYGGANIASSSYIKTLSPTLTINNGETLTAQAIVKKPVTVTDDLVFTFVIANPEPEGNSYKFIYDEGKGHFTDAEGLWVPELSNIITITKVGQKITFNIILDDLSSASTRFYNTFGGGSGHRFTKEGLDFTRELVSGKDFTLTVYVTCPNDRTVDQTGFAKDTNNSLFAYGPDTGKTVSENTAYITLGRHLQNLDNSSHVTNSITKAVQIGDILFDEDSAWYSEYADAYFNGTTNIYEPTESGHVAVVSMPDFKSITNNYLTEYDGSGDIITGLAIKTGGNAGLFGTVRNSITIKNTSLAGAHINGSNTGALVGRIYGTGTATVSGCQVYLSRDNGDIPGSISEENNVEAITWIGGNTAGGLVGLNEGNLTISSSSASTVIGKVVTDSYVGKASGISGGLIGRNSGTASINGSYADSYLYGAQAGGLIGSSTGDVRIRSSYTAGYIGLADSNSTGAGFVNGNATVITNSYTIMSCYAQAEDGGIDKESGKVSTDKDKGTYYSTAVSIGTTANTYYFNAGSSDENNVSGTSAIGQMTTRELLAALKGDSFEIDTTGTQPYRLMGQSLTTYVYPRISTLTHYGDWETSFQSGALVYYERYTGTETGQEYGFDGAGVSVSLRTDGTVLGDGYGIIFGANDSIPDKVTISFENGTSQDIYTSSSECYKASIQENGKLVSYKIYPLPKEQVNPTSALSGYYTRIKIVQSTDDTEPAYYDYNPHFARTVVEAVSADAPKTAVSSVKDISIRTPRQLYNLSLYYDNGYRGIVTNARYDQERDIDYSAYRWSTYTDFSSVSSQQPIGANENVSFRNTYNGGCYSISNISFASETGNYVGMFGYVADSGHLSNIVLATDYTVNGSDNYTVKRSAAAGANTTVYFGVLAGYNSGNISNCTVAGYSLTGSDATIRGYANSNLYIGGITGYNSGNIIGSSADFPRINVSLYRSTAYIGGAVGYNTGAVNASYAIGHIECAADGGAAHIAGFAGTNIGMIKNTYCAMAITSSGTGASTDGFAFSTGSISSSYYLKEGNYQFVDGLYAYDLDTSANGAVAKNYAQLKEANTSPAENSYNHNNTNIKDYPFQAVVKDINGKYVHYGEWPTNPELGNLGIFYWEHEEGGQNDGYKFTYIGTNQGASEYQTTLCESHDDGGIITEYGYGYYIESIESGEKFNVSVAWTDISVGTAVNTSAKESLETQVSGYTFYPYTTRVADSGDYIYLSGSDINGSVKLTYNGADEYVYTVSPFFANAMALTSSTTGMPANMNITDYAGITTNYSGTTVGSENNQYEIRSDEQLQYLNWNSTTKTTNEWLNFADYASNGNAAPDKWSAFTYLGYAYGTSYRSEAKYYFNQTHDIDADMEVNNGTTAAANLFTPIGSFCELNTGNNANVSAVYFNGTYNGNSYQIKNVEICSKSQGVGLFGITISADIQNIILYSDKGNKIQTASDSKYGNNTGDRNWYCLGGMAGVAALGGDSTGESAVFKNCTVSGYIICDNRNDFGYGGTNIGGFAGLSNVGVSNCSAVTDIQIQPNYNDSTKNIRVGGLVGNFRGATLENCYSGGSVSSTLANNTNIHVGGLVGGWFVRSNGNLYGDTSLFGTLTDKPTVRNCYTYTDLSGCTGSSVKTLCPVVSNANNENKGNNFTITNCYYYTLADISYKQRTLDNNSNVINVTYNQLSGDEDLTSGTYSGKNIQTALNAGADSGQWGWVTIVDASGASVDGKYSFPGNDTSLDGKNYPFPTVLTQEDLGLGDIVNVHYGSWPVNGPFWKYGTDSIDILDNLSNDGYAYRTYTLNLNGKSFGVIEPDMFLMNLEDYVAIDSFTDNGNTIEVKVKALKPGTVDITFSATDTSGITYGATFTLEIKDSLIVSSDPLLIPNFAEDDEETLTLSAVSADGLDYSTDEKLTWSLSASKDTDPEDGDVEITQTDIKNKYIVTGYGYDASVTVNATYDYNGIPITGKILVSIERYIKWGLVGLSDKAVFNQADVKETDTSTIPGTNVTDFSKTSIKKEPDYDGSGSYFIYATAGGNNTVDISANYKTYEVTADNNDITSLITVTVGQNKELKLKKPSDDDQPMIYRDLTLTYDSTGSSSHEDIENVSLSLTVTKASASYKLSLNGIKVLAGPYWNSASGTMDILDDMADDGYAYKTFILNLNGMSFGDITPDMFWFNEDDFAEVTSVNVKNDGTCEVSIKAINPGNGVLKFSAKDTSGIIYSASFELNITAQLTVSASPDSIDNLAQDEERTLILSAVSSNGTVYSNNTNLTWSLSGDVGIQGTADSNIYTITGLGNGATITVKASYDYNDVPITGTAFVKVTAAAGGTE